MSVEILIALGSSVVATAIAAGLSALAQRGIESGLAARFAAVLLRVFEPSGFRTANSAAPVATVELRTASASDDGLQIRLQEVRQAIRRQHSLATTFRISSSFLTFVQFVVGGLLASSFLQDKLSKEIVGALGLLVLASSLLRQHYRPEVQFVGAVQRETRLRSLLRSVEDHLFSRSEGDTDVPTNAELRAQLSEGLTAIEESEVRDVELLTQGSRSTRQPKKASAKR